MSGGFDQFPTFAFNSSKKFSIRTNSLSVTDQLMVKALTIPSAAWGCPSFAGDGMKQISA